MPGSPAWDGGKWDSLPEGAVGGCKDGGMGRPGMRAGGKGCAGVQLARRGNMVILGAACTVRACAVRGRVPG